MKLKASQLLLRTGGVGSVQTVHSMNCLSLQPASQGLVEAQSLPRPLSVLHPDLLQSRVEPFHWSRSTQILCSDWLRSILTPGPFCTWKPSLCYKDTVKGKNYPYKQGCGSEREWSQALQSLRYNLQLHITCIQYMIQ